LESTVASGTAPLVVASNTLVDNLNADLLDGKQGDDYLLKSGGTMTGTLTLKAGQYTDDYTGALNANNSNIYGVNSIYTADSSDGGSEGIHFYRDATHVDTLWMNSGVMYFVPNRVLGTNTTAANSKIIAHSGNVGTGDNNGQVKIAGTNVSVKGLGSNAYSSTAYLPLTGGTLSNATFGDALTIRRTDVRTLAAIRFQNYSSGTTV